jgi:hypothetical protein
MVKKSEEIKSKSLFDHINEIRENKTPDYYDNLTEEEQNQFNQFVILMGLSMDRDCINEIAIISKYLNIIPNKQFYKVCCDIIPRGKKYCKWIKNKKDKLDKELINILSLYYEIGKNDAIEYCEILMNSDNGIFDLTNILTKYGKSDKEIKAILK